MNKNETLVEVLKRTSWGDWVRMRNETTGKTMTIFVPRGK